MNILEENIWVEKYRPSCLDDLILDADIKDLFKKYKSNPKLVPSFIFNSNKPGTGKTSTARVLEKEFNCDFLEINSSEERGIDVIRDKINTYVRSLAINNFKRCVFLDEADGLTPQAQDSLRNLMETYSDNCFFILSCNNINKIIEPLRSRCTVVNFERPNVSQIDDRLKFICANEKLVIEPNKLMEIIDCYYPDIRSMVSYLQHYQIVDKLDSPKEQFGKFYKIIQQKDLQGIYEQVYSGNINVEAFNTWLFHKLFDQTEQFSFEKCKNIALLLADNEKSFNLGVNKEIVFIANIIKIGELLCLK